MATIAELLGVEREVTLHRAVEADRTAAIHFVAAGLKGSPFSRDCNGRLRRNGRFAPSPARNESARPAVGK